MGALNAKHRFSTFLASPLTIGKDVKNIYTNAKYIRSLLYSPDFASVKLELVQVETCEKCGCECDMQSCPSLIFDVSSIGVTTAKQMQDIVLADFAKDLDLGWGIKPLPKELPEIGYCDALEMAVCSDCYVSE